MSDILINCSFFYSGLEGKSGLNSISPAWHSSVNNLGMVIRIFPLKRQSAGIHGTYSSISRDWIMGIGKNHPILLHKCTLSTAAVVYEEE